MPTNSMLRRLLYCICVKKPMIYWFIGLYPKGQHFSAEKCIKLYDFHLKGELLVNSDEYPGTKS